MQQGGASPNYQTTAQMPVVEDQYATYRIGYAQTYDPAADPWHEDGMFPGRPGQAPVTMPYDPWEDDLDQPAQPAQPAQLPLQPPAQMQIPPQVPPQAFSQQQQQPTMPGALLCARCRPIPSAHHGPVGLHREALRVTRSPIAAEPMEPQLARPGPAPSADACDASVARGCRRHNLQYGCHL